MNLLIVGGTGEERLAVARAFHRESVLANGRLVSLDARRDEVRLRRGFEAWISGADPDGACGFLRAAECGTLFIDAVAGLTMETQRMLLAFTRRRLDAPSLEDGWVGRLAVGNAEPLAGTVSLGRFLPSLYDALDKVRVELPVAERKPWRPCCTCSGRAPRRRRSSSSIGHASRGDAGVPGWFRPLGHSGGMASVRGVP